MNTYTITNVDLNTSMVLVDYVYGNHTLSDLVPVSDATNIGIITTAVLAAYNTFKQQMDALDNAPTLPAPVQALIGQTQEVA